MRFVENIRERLNEAHPVVFGLYAIVAAFMVYFCMYAYRKPYSVAEFQSDSLSIRFLSDNFDFFKSFIPYKTVLIISQVMGYTLSKFYGIKFISEIEGNKRGRAIIALILIAQFSLLGFALAPQPYNIIFLFINGLPLGMIWGLVFGYLEGRRFTEALGAGLSASYIVASGAVKSIGQWILDMGYSEFWMPFIVGLIFFPVILSFVGMLKLLPPPTKEDQELRTERKPMYANDRSRFFMTFAPGLISLTFLYVFLTAYRDFRDNFAKEIWKDMGVKADPILFTASEVPILVGVLVILGILFTIKNNRLAMKTLFWIMISGSALIGIAALTFSLGIISPIWFMILVGMGLYMAYVPYGCILFDRLIATVGFVGTAGFMIYVTDAFGYLGSVALMLYKDLFKHSLNWVEFFVGVSYVTSIVSVGCFSMALVYFLRVLHEQDGEPSRRSEEIAAGPL